MIWVIGKNGMLGSELCRQLEDAKLPWIGTGHEVDVTDFSKLDNFARSVETAAYFPSKLNHHERQITWIVNCSAYTGVDAAEDEEEKARKVNAEGACNIARVARKIGAKLIHISSDYVFDGNADTPYTEDSQKNPTGVYGKSKAEAEDIIQKEMNQYYILRTSWLYGFDGKNFVYTMTNAMNCREEVKVVNDQKGTPTFAGDLAQVIIKLISKSEGATSFFGKNSIPSYGIYNYSNEGAITWFDFASEIYRLGKKTGKITKECKVEPCTTSEFPVKAKRPAYSVLCNDKIKKELKIKIPDWKNSLEFFMKNKRFNSN